MPFVPTRLALVLLIAGLPLSLLPLYMGEKGTAIWACFLVVVLFLFLFNAFQFRGMGDLSVELSTPSTYYLEEKQAVTIFVKSPYSMGFIGSLRLEVDGPVEWNTIDTPDKIEEGDNAFVFSFRPLRRGKVRFEEAILRLEVPLGLLKIDRRFSLEEKVRNLPNLKGVGRFALQFFGDPEARTGMKIEKHRGQGSEFDSLREYMPGFDIRTIDWKASARKGKLFCREFRAEQDHDIIFALDAGSLMATEFKGLAKVDYAINSLLVIAYMAMKSGDRVGLLTFDDKVRTYLKPQNKPQIIQQIGEACADLSYNFNPSNFVVAMEYLMTQQKKRALVLIFTDFVDAISAEIMKEYLMILSQRHLVVFVSIRDPFLDEFLEEPPEKLVDLHKKVAGFDLRNERFLLFRELQRMGVRCLDLFPTEISVPVLNTYLQIRRREMI